MSASAVRRLIVAGAVEVDGWVVKRPAVILAAGGLGGAAAAAATGAQRESDAEARARIDAAVKAANATLGPNQRIAAWRAWPEDDFPRTHTLKVKRDLVRAWAAVEAPLPVATER